MRYRWDKKFLYWGLTAFLVIAASAIFVAIVFNLDAVVGAVVSAINIIMPVFYGIAIAYLLTPLVNFFEKRWFSPLFRRIATIGRRKKGRRERVARKSQHEHIKSFVKHRSARVASIMLTMILLFAFLVAIIWLVVPQLFTTITELANNMQGYVNEATAWINSTLEPTETETLAENVFDWRNIALDILNSASTYVQDFLKNTLLPQMSNIVDTLSQGVMTVVGATLNIVLGIVISIYFLYSKEVFSAQVKKVIYCFFSVKHSNTILDNARHINKTFGGFISGKLLDSLIVGMLFFILLTIFDIPFAPLVSVFMGITNLVPYFGPFIGAIPSAFLILMDDPLKCLWFIIMVVVVQQLDGNILAPKIIGETTGLSSFWVIFALLLGQGIFGFIGLIIGIPLFSVVYSILRAWAISHLNKKGVPSDTAEYTDIYTIDAETHIPVSLSGVNAAEALAARQAERKKREEKAKAKEEKNNK